MTQQRMFLDFLLKEWLLFVSVSGVIVTSAYLNQLPSFSRDDIQIIFILTVLFITVKGLERSGLMMHLSQSLEKGTLLPLKLICAAFFLSMFITNDAALIVIVPLTLALTTDRKDILVILEALAANAGSALTPFGNPQNLFIYWFYNIQPKTFVLSIAPFSMIFLALFVLASLFVKTANNRKIKQANSAIKRSAFIYGALLLIVILTILRILPIQAGIIVIIYVILFDRGSLHIDYVLLLTLICFFGISENMKSIFAANLENAGHIFIFSALASQIISNVPATLLFAKFTTQWKALLWGANVGGFGSLVGSLANLIAFRLYTSHKNTNNPAAFTTKFIIIGYLAFFIGIGLYFGMEKMP
ncbi:MAG: hypothetical protein GXP60_04160 [Epsilonproteobacteria bacterium]|nr:hypothetical protein [Campylobacterota bacterium]